MPNWMTYIATMSAVIASGTSPAFSPDQVSGLVTWFDAGSGVYQESTFVTAATGADPAGGWLDRSTKLFHATQANTANRPTYTLSVINSRPAIQFDYVNDFLQNNSLGVLFSATADLPISVFIAFKSTLSSSAQTLLSMGRSNNNLPLYLSDITAINNYRHFRRDNGNVTEAVSGGTFDNNAHIWSTINMGSSASMYLDSNTMATQNASVNVGILTLDRSAIGCRDSNGTQNNFYSGYIAELVVYNVAVSDTDRQSIETYLNNKYAVY